jgi:hypothetical protein
VENAATWKHQGMSPVIVDHGQLKIAVKWCGRYRPPFHAAIVWRHISDALI